MSPIVITAFIVIALGFAVIYFNEKRINKLNKGKKRKK